MSEGSTDGLGPAARRAVTAATAEAGGGRIGTEHLLLGVLAVPSCAAAGVLQEAGVVVAAVRRKVGETSLGASPGPGPVRSPRAERALSRAHRFAHESRSPEVRSQHLLLGVLDVEGTAGQVLRGLGTDVDRLRSRLAAIDASHPDEVGAVEAGLDAVADRAPSAGPRCAACDADLGHAGLVATRVATSPDGGSATVLSCPSCGMAIGAAPS
ncbi:MAG TPA: Clp protease N-terminal domain-containing protein [Acidimicrobiales bacterium]|nr:Clp protease N-terminal domain-containing protein [Acidimicrobiales bacterium]